MTKVLHLLAVAAFVAMSATPALAQTKGTISALGNEKKEFTLKTADGKEIKGTISATRTKVTIKGASAGRDALRAGLICTVTPAGGGEALVIACD